MLRIDSVNLETKANFTCMAFNEAGEGDPATIFIDVAGLFTSPIERLDSFDFPSSPVASP